MTRKSLTDAPAHRAVLADQAVRYLVTEPDGTYLDATFGRGGHSRLVLQALGPHGRLIALDRDPQAVEAAASILDPRFHIEHTAFSRLEQILAVAGVSALNGALFDIGVSSPQIDDRRARLLVAQRCTARHAHGHDTRRDGSRMARRRID